MLLKRVKQVFAAVTANITAQDRYFVAEYLDSLVQPLFWQMSLPDQRHALNVAYTAQSLVKQRRIKLDNDKLIKCCLLHDIGRVNGDVSTFDKIMLVLCYKFIANQSRQWQHYGKGGKWQNFCHALYIYEHHPQLGANKLRELGLDELSKIIIKHHQLPHYDDSAELLILREADELN